MSQPLPYRPDDERRPFTGDEAAPLDLRTAARWTATDRERNAQLARQPQAYFFGRKIIDRILAQPGCVGLRVHSATDPDTGQRHLLITGVDERQNDQLPPLDAAPRPLRPAALGASAAEQPADPDFVIAEMAIPCPNQCGDSNPLNGRQ